ncbi:MAG: response regulator [Bacteroidales bacterium]
MNKINIAVIDDHDLFREGVTLLLEQIEGFSVVYDDSDGMRFLDALDKIAVDIVLMDIEMPVINGVQTSEKALQKKPELKIIALSMFSDTGHYLQMINAGVKGFLLKKANKYELEQAIITVYNGSSYFSQEIIRKLAYQYSDKNSNSDQLTTRELEITVMICQGLTTQEISDRLNIAAKTVETHRSNIFLKAGVKNTAGLIVWAVKNQYYSII